MPATRHALFLSIVFLILAATASFTWKIGDKYSPPKDFPPDGLLTDWGNGQVYSKDYSHLYDNEAQWLDNADTFEVGKIPPGGDPNAPGGGEDPLHHSVVKPDGVPMGSGFNLVSGLASYDPYYKGGTYWLAMDLPGPTNELLSESFFNKYIFRYFGIKLYPVPFDADCNEDPDEIDDDTFFGSIYNGTIGDNDREIYLIDLWVAGDYTQGWNYSGSPGDGFDAPYGGPGFPILIEMEMDFSHFKPYEFRTLIPGHFTKSGVDLDLLDVGGECLAFDSSPESLVPHEEYDIEVEINGIWEKILPLIDQSKLMKEVTKDDCRTAYIEMQADSNGDESDEELICLGLNASFPSKHRALPALRWEGAVLLMLMVSGSILSRILRGR